MTADNGALTGPDLGKVGCVEATVADGAMILGRAGAEAVLLARRGDEFFAVSAACSHYSGPLADGILVGDTVRCPWHHACFSLRTGEALRAPALNPIDCWDLERRGGRVFVTRKRPARDPLARVESMVSGTTVPGTLPATVPATIVIIGAGAAGSAAAEMLRRQGYSGPVTMVDIEADSPYDRPNLSKDYLAGTAQADWIPLRPPGFYEAHGIERAAAQATAIDLQHSRVDLSDGRSLPFGALVLATGAEPVRLDIPGASRAFVHTLRSFADSRAIADAAGQAKRAVVIGASFIGLEVAASLRHRNIEVHVVAPESTPLERVLGKDLGSFVRQLHEARGVTFHLSTTASRIDESAVVLADGTSLPADLVVVGVGVRPRLDLAQKAGLALDRGVVVNEYLETSAPRVYAAGDIARWPDHGGAGRIRVEHWVVAQRQGQTAARNILGARERFDAVPFFWSQHYDLTIRYSGHAEAWGEIDVAGALAGGVASVAYRAGPQTLAVASLAQDRANLEAEAALERGDEQALHRLIPSG